MEIIWEDDKKIVLEGRKKPNLDYFIVALVIGFFVIIVSVIVPKNEKLAIFLGITIFFTLPFLRQLGDELAERRAFREQLVLDKESRTIHHCYIRNNRFIVKNIYKFQEAKYISMAVYSYENFCSALVLEKIFHASNKTQLSSRIHTIEIVSGGLETTNDHRNKIALTNKIAKFIGVPAVETSR